MTKLKISILFLIVVLIKTSFTKPIESSTESVESTDEDDLTSNDLFGFLVVSNFLSLTVNAAEESANISRKLLKDEDLLASAEPEVLEFKQNLTNFIEEFDKKQESEEVFDTIDTFASLADHYLNLSDEKINPESKFIKKLLKKYHAEDIENHFKKNFAEFADNLAFLFDTAKDDLDKPLLDWYEKFKGINDFAEQIEALSEFVELL